MKKTLSLILALLMSASCAVSIFADEAEATSVITEEAPADTEVETPVEEEATEYDLAVNFLVYKDIMQGKGETEDGELILGVKDPVKRYEMAIFAGRIATGWTDSRDWENGEDDRTEFTDLEGSGAAAAYGILSYVAEKNIIKGYPDGSFKPEATVTYRDALAIVVRTLGYNPDYPWGVIEKAVTLGLTDGITGVAYTDAINRGVAAQIMYNALFNATTAKGTKLAMDSFDVEYGWENIVVVADEIATYEIGDKTTKDGKGIVSFKLVEDNGELSDDVYYVHADIDGDKVADLTFGDFYNALFEIDKDEELVDMIGAIKYDVYKTIKNEGLTDDAKKAHTDLTPIKTFMADYSVVEKYNVKNLSKETLYNDEIIVVADKSETVAIAWGAQGQYAINWETGDIIKLNTTTSKWETEWYYNEMFDLYFKWDTSKDINEFIAEKFDKEIAGIKIMSEDDLAKLKAEIKKTQESAWTTYEGYTNYGGAYDAPFAKLVVYDFDGDEMGDYAKYNTYKLAKYNGKKTDADVKRCGSCDATQYYSFGSEFYAIAGSCAHVDNDTTYTVTGLTDGFTGYVIYDVDNAAHTIEVIKEVAEYGKNTDEDTYFAYGIVRGVDAANSAVVIGNDKIYFNFDNLDGTQFKSADKKAIANDFFNNLFNQFVKYYLVDGKLVDVEIQGKGGNNYLVVEGYYGIDSDGYIVVSGYMTDNLNLKTYRIGAIDGWKTGSGFFYNEEEMEEAFTKGNVFQITSTDNTEKNGNVYNVTTLGAYEKQYRDQMYVGITGYTKDNSDVRVRFEDNYRTITFPNAAKVKDADGNEVEKTETVKMSSKDKYVIVQTAGYTGKYMPIYTYTGIVEDDVNWWINGDLLVKADNLFIFVNAGCHGFNYDDVNVGFIAFPGKINYLDVQFDGYNKDYYVYGATTYTVEGFNLMTCEAEKTAVATNIDIDANKIYATVDGTIIDDENAYEWYDFVDEAMRAFGDRDTDTADYLFWNGWLPVKADAAADEKWFSENVLSGEKGGVNGIRKGLLGLKSSHADLIGDFVIKAITLDGTTKDHEGEDGNLTAIGDYKHDVTDDYVWANFIYNVASEKAIVYVNTKLTDNDPEPKKPATVVVPATNKLEKDTDAYITAGAKVTSVITADGTAVDYYTLDSIVLSFAGDATTDTHKSIDVDNLHFGEFDACKIDDWNTKINIGLVMNGDVDATKGDEVYGTIKTVLYGEDEEDHEDDCKLIKAVEIAFNKPVKLTAGDWYKIQVYFETNEFEPTVGNVDVNWKPAAQGHRFTVVALGSATGISEFKFESTNQSAGAHLAIVPAAK